jgi:Ras-related protein Rab-22
MGSSVKEVKLCLLGDSGVGKSSIVHRFVYDAFKQSMESTIGAAFLTKSITLDLVVYKYQIWDTAGQEKYRALAPMYYRGAAAAIVVYDITREDSFTAVKSWIRELKQYADADIVLAITGNKCDLEELREVTYTDAQTYANLQGAIFVETSAKTAINVSALFLEISKRLSQQTDRYRTFGPSADTLGASTIRKPMVTATASDRTKKSCCS